MPPTHWLREPYLRWPVRATAVAVLAPGLVTLLAAFPVHIPSQVAALLYVPAVVGAAAFGGPIAGLGAALLSYLGLNYYFWAPLYSLAIDQTADLLAVVVFMVVALVIGLLVAWALAGRDRLRRRDRESRLLNDVVTRLLSGHPLEDVLEAFAGALVDMYGFQRAEVRTNVLGQEAVVLGGSREVPQRVEAFAVSMSIKKQELGTITVWPTRARRRIDRDEQDALRAYASQLALAFEGIRSTEEARKAKIEAEATRMRAILFSSVTHDFRTPLASIRASVTSLIDGDAGFTPESRRAHLDTINEEAGRLNRLVGNLLDLTRMRAGVLTPAKTGASIDEVIESVVARLRPLLVDRDVKLLVPDDLPEVPMDVMQIDQVLTNLIENAAKFSPPGSPLRISAGPRNGAVRVTVEDRGPGIPRFRRERLFEPFHRGDSELGAGTGLGLAIAKAIVEAHGGTIWLDDGPHGGLSVSFELLVG